MTLSTNIYARISAVEDIAGDLEVTRSAFAERDPIALPDGTASGKADLKWSDTRTVAPSSNEELDLNALTDSLGRTINFAKVKALHIRAKATNVNNVVVGAAGSNPFLGPLGGTTPTITLPPGGILLLVAPAAGWSSANGATDKLKVANSGSGTGVDYDIEIIGTSA